MDEHLRLKKIRTALKMSQGQLAAAIDRKQGSISDIERGRNSIDGITELLKLKFGVSPAWLRHGEGEMFLASDSEGVPYYDIELSAAANGFGQVNEPPEYYINCRPFNDCTAYLPFYGDSMYPKYLNGDIIAVKEVKNPDIVLWGEAYLVITDEAANSLRAVRLLIEHKDKSKVILRAANPDFKGDTVIDKKSIASLHIVKGRITMTV